MQGETSDANKVDELSRLVRQLVHALKKHQPDSDLAKRALDYLCQHGLQGSPLRTESHERDADEDAYVIDKLGHLLAEIAVIVNGPEPPLTRWSYHDLPDKVRALKGGIEPPEGWTPPSYKPRLTG